MDETESAGADAHVQRLERFRRRMEGAMLAGDVAWWEMDVETGAATFHENKTEMLGLPAEEFEHYEDFTERLHPDDYEDAMEAMRAHLEGRASKYDTEYRIEDADGEYRWFHDVGGVTEWGEDGEPLTVTGIVVDVTARKRTEAELRRTNEQLTLLNRVVRHDIRNDMSVVSGWLDVLAETDLTDEQREHVARAQRAAEHTTQLTETVRDLLDVIEGEDASVSVEPVNLAETLRSEVQRLQDTFDDVAVETALGDGDVWVTANAMLSTVFTNLLNNAVQHTDEDVARIAVDVSTEGETATVTIADNGPGIPASIREDLFEQGATGPESLGSGVGLYLVHTLVTAYDGRVDVTDNDPKGTVFTIDLPLADPPADA